MASFDQATERFKNSFLRLKDSVHRADADIFQQTTLEQVKDAAKEIEKEQRKRKSMTNMARIRPFLEALEQYSKAIDVLCNGTDYLPWIWAPIKLMLQVASESSSALDAILNAYGRIAEAMPNFSRLGTAFQDTPSVREVLSFIYEDILEFHRRAYKFLRGRAWHIFFDALWKSFDRGRLRGIIDEISKHKGLLLEEVQIIDVIAAKKARDIAKDELDERERKKEITHLHDSIAWLKIADEVQLDTLEQLLEERQDGTCEWIISNPVFKSWKNDAHSEPIVWLNGIPGAGKTVLCSYVINSLREDSSISAPFYICNSYNNGKVLLSEVLRSLTAQLLRKHKELAPHIFDKYANTGLSPSVSHLKNLLVDFLATIPTIRMCVDGLDEFPDSDQRRIMQELTALCKASDGRFRMFFSSREVALITNVMKGKPLISLNNERAAISSDIAAYVHDSLLDIRSNFDEDFFVDIENQVVMKAKGMFLWVRLVLSNLRNCHSKRELQAAVDQLPDGLEAAYGRILTRIKSNLGSQSNTDKAVRILEWIACSFRALKVYEVQDGIVFVDLDAILNEDTKINNNFLDICKPLIQKGPNKTIEFVHYSAKEYILDSMSGPFLGFAKAHYDLAFSCILYLNTTNCFSESSHNQDEIKLRVLSGLHGLHHYANEFWLQHLLLYSKTNERQENEDDLKYALMELGEMWKEDSGQAHHSLKLDDTTTQDIIEREIECLGKDEEILGMSRDILTLRSFLTQEKYSHQEAEDMNALALKHDPTSFSAISQKYQEIVQHYINCDVDDLPSGGSPDMLDKFRATYLESAFICRYRNCPRFSDGFTSAYNRDEHEQGHIKPLRCADPSCELFDRGFASRTGLVKHNKKFHPGPEQLEVPTFESISAPEPIPIKPPAVERLPTPPQQADPSPTPPEIKSPARKEKTVRVSRALRGKPVHHCSYCQKVFTRAEGLRRHEVIHYAPKYSCHLDGCQKQFHREDLLKRHLSRHLRKISESMTGDGTVGEAQRSADEPDDGGESN